MEEKLLRSGLTTGTCAAAAAKAAAVRLLTGKLCHQINIKLPQGNSVTLETEEMLLRNDQEACFRVQKDAGDDPDVTNHTWVYGSISLHKEKEKRWYRSDQYPNLYLTAGEGIGMVTKKGLSCPVGMPAINPVPREMIFCSVGEVAAGLAIQSELFIRIEIPAGVMLADRTFNPKLGILGGISILGTTGMVEPMSDQALLETIRLEAHMKAIEGQCKIIITPGNYGEQFLKQNLNMSLLTAIKCSNFIYDSFQILVAEGFLKVLFIGHIGKLIKIAGGIKNTHSKFGDRRMELLAECIKEVYQQNQLVDKGVLAQVRGANTTEEALYYLAEAGLLELVGDFVVKKIHHVIMGWTERKIDLEIVMFSNVYGILGKQNWIREQKEKLWLEYCTE